MVSFGCMGGTSITLHNPVLGFDEYNVIVYIPLCYQYMMRLYLSGEVRI